MKYLLTSLCVISVAALPAAASANAERDTASSKPIVIAYIPEYLQHRVPGHQHEPPESETPEPWLLLELDSSGFKATPAAPFGHVAPSQDEAVRRRKSLGLGIGLGIGIPLVMGVAIGTAMSLQSINQIGQ